MPTEPKAPYKLTIKLDGAKPERIAEALAELRERAADCDQTGEASATMTLEGYQEAPLREVMDAFETWLFENAPGIGCEVKLARPGIRPETIAMRQREKQDTPMDRIQGFADRYGVESVTLSHAGRSVTLDANTARNAAAMLDDEVL